MRVRNLCLVGALSLLIVNGIVAAGGLDPDMAWRAIGIDERLQGGAGTPGTGDAFLVEVPSPGELWIDVQTPEAAAPAGLVLAEPLNLEMKTGQAVGSVVKESPACLVLAIIEPGPVLFRVVPQDPFAALHEYTLSCRFSGWQDKDEEEGEIDPILGCLRQGDDHCDTAGSATALSLGEITVGVLENDATADLDYFTFRLDEQRTVVIETRGDTDTFGVLFDHNGYRLAADDSSGGDANFRIARILVPGRYFVRVEGRFRAEGPYTLVTGTTSR